MKIRLSFFCIWAILFAFIVLPLPAQAGLLDILFTTNGDGNPGDTVSGELIGLQNGTNQDPSQIIITQAPASLGLNASVGNPYVLNVTNYLTTNAGGTILSSATPGIYGFNISLVGGVESINLPLDIAFENAAGNGIGFNFYSTALGTGFNGALFNGVADYAQTGFAGTTFTVVPEPRDYARLLLLGVALIVILRKIRLSDRIRRCLG